jgi:hypothetical protein
VSPIFVRPVREQLEHDRLIRFLQPKYKRKQEVAANVGDEQVAPIKVGHNLLYPDLVLTDGKDLTGLVEVESGESVNNLEAMAQWTHFSRMKVPFHLYVPTHVYDAARRLALANNVNVAEIWAYRSTNEGFDLVRMYHDAAAAALRPRSRARTGKASKGATRPLKARTKATKPARKVATAKAGRPAKAAKAKPPAKPGKAAARRSKSGGGAAKKAGLKVTKARKR